MQNNNSNGYRYKFSPLKLLAYFMTIIIILTIFSHAADSLTVSIVTTTKFKKNSINHGIESSGNIEADNEIKIIADTGLNVKDINFKAGETVNAGDNLITLNTTALENNIYNVETELKKSNLELSELDIYSNDNVKLKQREIEKKKKEPLDIENDFNIKIQYANEDIDIAKEDIAKAKNKLSIFTEKDEKKQLEEGQNLVSKLEKNLDDLKYQKEKELKESQFSIDNAEFNLATIIKNEEAFASEELKRAEQNYENIQNTWIDKTNSMNEDLQLSYINWQSLQEAYNQALEQGDDEHIEQYRQQMEEYKDNYIKQNTKIEDADTQKKDALKKAEQSIEAAKTEKDVIIQSQKDKAQMEINQAEAKYSLVENDYNRKIDNAQKELDDSNDTLNKILKGDYDVNSISDIEQSIESFEKILKTKERELENIYSQKQLELSKIDSDIDNLNLDILNEQENEQNLIKKNSIAKDKLLIDIASKTRQLEQLKKIYNKGNIIASPVDGIVTSINTDIGKDTNNEVIATIAKTDSEYYLKIKVDKEQSKYISSNDEAIITLAGETKSIEGSKVDTITNLKGEDSDKVEIKILLPKGKGELGMSADVTLNKSTDKYDMTVPISAIRESSSNEKYVLIISEQNNILGKQFVAQKVIVNEIDRDNYNVAIRASLTYESQIIINSNKPIVAGDRVRLIEQ